MIHARNLAAGALAALMLAGAVPALAADTTPLPEDPAGQEETVTEHKKPSRKKSGGTENTDGTESGESSESTARPRRKGGRKRPQSSEEGTEVSSDGTVKKARPADKPSRKPSSRPGQDVTGSDGTSGGTGSDGTVNTEKPSRKPARRSEQQSDAVTSATPVI